MLRLSGKVAIVTGAATGLGRAIAVRFAAEGAKVALVDVADVAACKAEIDAVGGESLALTADISAEDEIERAVATVQSMWGCIDILINNAAVASEVAPAPFEQQTAREWRRILDVNVVGTFLACRAIAPFMRARKYGRIVNFSSGTTLRGQPNVLHYVASKGAVGAMTLGLANELGADNVTVNTIAPGYILTEGNLANETMSAAIREMVVQRRAVKREGVPDDVVGAVLFLASDEASFISGQTIVVNGGLP